MLADIRADARRAATLAAEVNASLTTMATIGIGAGAGTDGQILVWTDFAGLHAGKPRKFVKRYLELRSDLVKAAAAYRNEIASGEFPTQENEF